MNGKKELWIGIQTTNPLKLRFCSVNWCLHVESEAQRASPQVLTRQNDALGANAPKRSSKSFDSRRVSAKATLQALTRQSEAQRASLKNEILKYSL